MSGDLLKDYMAGWKELGHSGTGLRKLLAKISMRRGLESYTAYALDEAAARIDQLEDALRALGIEVLPAPEPADKEERAFLLTKAMVDAEYGAHDIRTLVWSHYGDDPQKAAFARCQAEKGKEGA